MASCGDEIAGLTLALLTLSSLALAEDAKPYTSKALGFSATYPYEVKEALNPAGGGTAAGFNPQGIMYMVGVLPVPPEVAKKPVKEQLDDGLAGAVAKVNGTIASQKDIKLGKNPGREVEIALQGGHATFRAIIVGKETYLIGVVHKDGLTPPLAAPDFFKSFKLEKKAK